ncbi:17623_t:CDS:1, partial [Gigaspora margarita]
TPRRLTRKRCKFDKKSPENDANPLKPPNTRKLTRKKNKARKTRRRTTQIREESPENDENLLKNA